MTDFKLDDNHDLAVSGNQLQLISGADEVAQRLRCNLRAFQGEWFLDESVGVPYFETVFVKGMPLDRIAAALQHVIITTPGVLELQEYSQSFDGASRQLSVTFTVLATDGEIIDFNEEIP